MSDTKTGNKGFVNPVDGKVYHIDQVPVGEDGVNIPENLKSLDPGSINVDNTIKDIGKKTRITLGTYLSKATKGEVGSATVPNKYSIDAPTENSLTSKIVEGGYPAPISPTTNSSKFAGNLPSSVSDNYIKASNTVGSGRNAVTTIVGKGKSQESSTKNILDGNELLPGVGKDALQPALEAYTAAATSPKFRTSFVSLDDFQSPPRTLNIALQKVRVITDGIDVKDTSTVGYGGGGSSPDEVVKPILATNGVLTGLDLAFVVQKPRIITKDNAYPVVTLELNKFKADDLYHISSIDGKYPSPITPPSAINTAIFTSTPGRSVSDNYIKASNTVGSGDNAVTTVIGKGKSLETATKKLLDGNELLPGVGKDALQPALKAYTAAATSPNYRTSFVSFSDFKTPPKSLDVPLVDLPNNYFKKPNEESVISGQLTLNLQKAVKKVASLTAGEDLESPGPPNVYPVSIPDKFDASTDLASISSADGKYPSPLTTPTNENLSIFAGNLPSSFSEDYSALQGADGNDKVKKGKSSASGKDGNDLLSSTSVDPAITTVVSKYQTYSFVPNYRTSFVSFSDFKTPPKSLDVPLVDLPNNYFKKPNEESVISGQLTLNLQKAVKKVASLTAGEDLESPGPPNVYPVSIPDKFDASTDLASISSADGKYPSPLTTPTNENLSIFAGNLPSSFSEDYSALQENGPGFKKGKSPLSLLDGNDLLPSAADKAPAGGVYVKNALKLNDPIQTYTQSVIKDNTFKDEVGSLSGNKFLDSSVDASAPPGDFEPQINNVVAPSFGTYSDATKDPVTLIDLRSHAITTTAGNDYPVPDPLLPVSSLSDGSGNPSPLSQEGGEEIFVQPKNINPKSSDASLIDSGFSKGKTKAKYDGHNLLPSVGGNLNVVDDRFSHPHARGGLGNSYEIGGDGNETIEDFGTTITDTTPVDHPLKKYTGVGVQQSAILSAGNNRWAARAGASKGFNPKLKIPDSESPSGFSEVSHLRMAKIGTGLLQRASGESPARIEGAKFNPTGADAEGRALVPSGVQLGITKVNYATLTAQDVFRHLSEGEEDVDSLINIARGLSGDDESWGATNSSSEPYDDGLSNIGAATTMLLMVVAIATLYEIFGLVGNNTRADTKENGQYVKGKYLFEKQRGPGFFSFMPNAYEIFGIRKTNNNYRKSLATGAKAFFTGSEKPNTSLAELITTLAGAGVDSLIGENSIVNANLVVCRTIVRSALVFAIAIDSLIRRSQNPATGFKNSISFLSVWRSSKLVASMNTFSALGDVLLDRQSSTRKVIGPDGKEMILTPIDEIPVRNSATLEDVSTTEKPLLDRTSVRKGRLTVGENYNPTLAWSSQRAPSMYLLPSKVVGLQSAMDDKPVIHNTKNSMLKLMETSGIRITNNERQEFEKLLDAEYVPFSFQDVRTNEVISFHAFLSSLSDDYSAAYDSVEGFGRVEPIKIYKSTTRKIGMSFHIVSTSPQDFDHMWYKINKLLMFVYPQYTPGRDLISSEGGQTYQFKAPFSQQPGASPLVRIRLGDLIRSNYSKFALARLFGAADDNMKIPRSVADRTSTPIDTTGAWKEEQTKIVAAAAVLRTYANELEVNASNSVPNIADLAVIAANAQIARENAEKDLAAAKKKKAPAAAPLILAAEAAAAAAAATAEKALAALNSGTKAEAALAEAKAEAEACRKTESDARAFLNSFVDKSEVKTTLDAFMNPDNNVIVKSFESAGGKGLAGFIESMNFDWYNQTTWDTDLDRTAPKMCKVTLSFSPIHDITPGLDQHGYNRAPVYPVGTYSKPKNS